MYLSLNIYNYYHTKTNTLKRLTRLIRDHCVGTKSLSHACYYYHLLSIMHEIIPTHWYWYWDLKLLQKYSRSNVTCWCWRRTTFGLWEVIGHLSHEVPVNWWICLVVLCTNIVKKCLYPFFGFCRHYVVLLCFINIFDYHFRCSIRNLKNIVYMTIVGMQSRSWLSRHKRNWLCTAVNTTLKP